MAIPNELSLAKEPLSNAEEISSSDKEGAKNVHLTFSFLPFSTPHEPLLDGTLKRAYFFLQERLLFLPVF